MTDMHDDANATAHEAETESQSEPQAWTPPDRLTPPPAISAGRFPAMSLGLAFAVSVAAGVALWGSSQFFYIYIFYNFLVGGALGWALSFAPKREGFTNLNVLRAAGVVLATLPYVLVKVLFAVQLLPALRNEGVDATFVQVLWFLFDSDTLFGIELGLVGSVVLLLVEAGITVYALFGRLQQGLAEARIESIPSDVVDFVVGGLVSGWDTATLRDELARRGWRNADDQDRAISTGFDVIQALQAAQG